MFHVITIFFLFHSHFASFHLFISFAADVVASLQSNIELRPKMQQLFIPTSHSLAAQCIIYASSSTGIMLLWLISVIMVLLNALRFTFAVINHDLMLKLKALVVIQNSAFFLVENRYWSRLMRLYQSQTIHKLSQRINSNYGLNQN